MPIHTDPYCDCDENCDECCNGTCAACCEKHAYACPDCACVDAEGIEMLDCECPCHYDGLSDKELRAAERRQMGIT
jgi:hypothetical protein